MQSFFAAVRASKLYGWAFHVHWPLNSSCVLCDFIKWLLCEQQMECTSESGNSQSVSFFSVFVYVFHISSVEVLVPCS